MGRRRAEADRRQRRERYLMPAAPTFAPAPQSAISNSPQSRRLRALRRSCPSNLSEARWPANSFSGPLEERVAEVIRRAVLKVPGDVGQALLSLLTPESLAIVVGTIAVGAAAHLTP